MIVLIDNYDSFSYNLFQYVGEIDTDIDVVRNDEIDARDMREIAPSHIIISPGPGYPSDAGNCVSIVREISGSIPILGVCLGHQAICEAFGANITHARQLMHGKQSLVNLDGACPLFANMPNKTEVARYHSLAVDPASLPDCLRVTASAADGEIMAVQHATHPTFGVQFHPESIMTPQGKTILRNFLDIDKTTGKERK